MEREFFNERNCFQHDAKPENFASMSLLALIILFIKSSKDLWLAFGVVYTLPTRTPEGLLPNKIKQNNTFFVLE